VLQPTDGPLVLPAVHDQNEGTAPTGDFSYRVNGVNGKDMYSGQIQNSATVEKRQKSLAPGETRSGTFNITGQVVTDRTWACSPTCTRRRRSPS
jgi:hypothetical protein